MAEASRTELAVLGLLAWAGESSGYALLKRLDADGLVRGRRVKQSDRPDKRLFSLTEAGRSTLGAWLGRVEAIEPEDRDGVLLKVFFAAHGDVDAGRAQLLDWRGRVEVRPGRGGGRGGGGPPGLRPRGRRSRRAGSRSGSAPATAGGWRACSPRPAA